MDENGAAHSRQYFLSYRDLRKLVGLLGMILPVAVVVRGFLEFGLDIPSSISAYYYTNADAVLVGTLFAIGVFLLAYRGPKGEDRVPGRIAGLGAIGVALFPTGYPDHLPEGARCAAIDGLPPPSCVPQFVAGDYVHLAAAAVFFLTLAFLAYFRFTLSGLPSEARLPRQKARRNRIYRTCAVVMVAMLALIIIDGEVGLGEAIGTRALVTWLETIAIWAFGFAWLTKGQALFPDETAVSEQRTGTAQAV